MQAITSFQGDYRFLSNFWPCYLEYKDILYPTLEHAYQAAKVRSQDMKLKIRDCPTPAEAKDFFEKHAISVENWTTTKKLSVMEELIEIKFGGKEPLLTRALLATGDADLFEGNSWGDKFWGVYNNEGENNLGKLLMKTREGLIQEKDRILVELEKHNGNDAVAASLSMNRRQLYEKMIAFGIRNKEFWIS